MLVVACNKQVFTFFNSCTDIPVISIDVESSLVTKEKPYKLLSNIFSAYWEYYKKFSKYEGCNVYFFGNSWSIVPFYYIKNLARHNNVYQHRASHHPHETVVINNMMSNLVKTFIKFIFQLNVDVVVNNDVKNIQLKESFYKRNNITVYEVDLDKTKNKKYTQNIHHIQGHDILFVSEDLPFYNRATSQDFELFMNKVNDSLKKYVVKPHPNTPTLYGVMKLCVTSIPKYIPSEFLMHHDWKYIVGIESFTLIRATELTKAKVISLVKITPYINKVAQQDFIDWFKFTPVLMPETFDEFKEMINETSN